MSWIRWRKTFAILLSGLSFNCRPCETSSVRFNAISLHSINTLFLYFYVFIRFNRFSLTIFDCANKFVGFSSPLMTAEPITVAASEWGYLFILTSDGNLWQLREKDLQTKMSVFYKKNHYDLAVKVSTFKIIIILRYKSASYLIFELHGFIVGSEM